MAGELRSLYRISRTPETAGDGRFWSAASRLWEEVRQVHEHHLAALKDLLREGLLRFEAHEHEVVEGAGPELVDLLRAVPDLLEATHVRIADAWDRAEAVGH